MFKSVFKKLEFKFNRKDTAKIKNMKKLLLVITALISTIAFGQNHFIGHTTITFQDPDRGNRSIETEIYYPATTAGDNVSAINEKFPVIVFGHGFVMAWSAYKNLWEEFVPKGYIMVFPRTEGNILSTDHQKFGWDLQFLVTEMQNLGNNSSSLLYNCIAPETALMGHSMGGGAAFLAADSLCVNGNTNLKTLIGLAPAESSTNGVSSIASATKITVPSLILSGVQDGVTPPNEHHIPMYNSLASDCKSIINVTGGAHCYFANSNTACDFGEGTSSSGISITRTEQHEITFDYVNLWLDYTLKGNCFAFDIFNDSLVNATRVTYDQVCGTPPAIEVFNTVDICDGDSYTFPDGTVGSSSMVNTSNLTTQKGCDSIIETTLTVLLPIETYESKSICQGDNYTFPDGTIGNSSGTHISTLTASNGCDSIVETTLNVSSSIEVFETESICQGDSYIFPDGTTGNSEMVHTSYLTASAGCDSIIETTLNIIAPYETYESKSICQGDSYTFPDGTIGNSSGTHINTLTTSNGCDSIVETTLNVSSSIEVFETESICQGDSYIFPDGTTGNSEMVHTSYLTASAGCDSIIETTLNIIAPYETYESKSICQGDSYTFPDGTIGNSSGTHISTLTASNGCDSIVETYLSVTTIDTTVINNSNELTAVQNNANYQWINCSDMSNISNETNISYTPSSSGTYAVEITINGCSSTSSCHKTELLGINHESGNSLFKLYPNPSNGIINIENNKGKTVLIYDSKLSLVYTSSLKIGKQVLDTNLSSGIYIWKAIESNGEIKSGKLIIN